MFQLSTWFFKNWLITTITIFQSVSELTVLQLNLKYGCNKLWISFSYWFVFFYIEGVLPTTEMSFSSVAAMKPILTKSSLSPQEDLESFIKLEI